MLISSKTQCQKSTKNKKMVKNQLIINKYQSVNNQKKDINIFSSIMLGPLQKNSIIINKEYIIIAYGCQSYVFNTVTQNCIKNVHLGLSNDILCSSFLENKKGNAQLIASIDSQGVIAVAELSFGKVSGKTEYQQFGVKNIRKYSLFGKNQKHSIKQAVFTSPRSILSITQAGQLRITYIQTPQIQPQSHPLFPQNKFSHIFYSPTSPNYTFLIEEEGNKVSILENESQKILKNYTHHTRITSITNIESTLAVGDSRGKIYLQHNYLAQKGDKNKGKSFETVLEWHTGPVSALCSIGKHLYSAGQESVVVLWHTTDFRRDFLPRVGTPIKYLFVQVQTNQIVCILSDNSIKIIDLSKDKQTFTYKTILDPKGYAPVEGPRFNIDTTCYHNGTLCLKSVAGKIQLINLERNLENMEMQIVPRNLINAINKDKLQPHRIQSFCFSADWSYACFCVNSATRSYLKFYRKGPVGYQLMNRVQYPHLGKTNGCLAVSNKVHSQFVTYCQQDAILRVWTQHVQKKKSLLDSNQTFWKCSQEISYRGLKPTFISSNGPFLLVVYQNKQIIIYQLDSKGILTSKSLIPFSHPVTQSKLLQFSQQKDTKLYKLLMQQKNQFHLICYMENQKQVKISSNQKLTPKQQINSYFINVGLKQTALVINFQKGGKIVIVDHKTSKFVESYDTDAKIQSSFWKNQRLIVLWENLRIEALDGKDFVQFQKLQPQEIGMQEEESTEVKIYGEADIFKLNQKWVERQVLKKKSKIIDSTQGLYQLPNCISMWAQMSEKLLI